MKPNLTFLFFSLIFKLGCAQVAKESTKVDFIKSIHFSSLKNQQHFPLVRLGESFTLLFDDLQGQGDDYYYQIKHFNHDWTPSVLFSNQYLNGFDNQRIQNFRSSYGTLQRYTNYALTLPNENTQFIVSGNYMLEIYDAYDELMFSRKFVLYEEKSTVELGVYPVQDLNRFSTHQNLQFAITTAGFQVRNLEKDLNVWLLQNEQWANAKKAPLPQYIRGNRLEYRYDTPTQFEGGNEFLFFDTKDIRVTTPSISFVEKGSLYQHYLYTDSSRKGLTYSYFPDINGNFLIQTLQGTDPDIEADYSIVYFSLARQYGLNDEELFIYGKFNNYALTDENKLIYNPSLEVYEGILLLKQGFYNYKYVSRTGNTVNINGISGNYMQTENNYTLLVYHRPQGQLYDQLIGYGNVQSLSLSN